MCYTARQASIASLLQPGSLAQHNQCIGQEGTVSVNVTVNKSFPKKSSQKVITVEVFLTVTPNHIFGGDESETETSPERPQPFIFTVYLYVYCFSIWN